jgi:hypothetical protein
MHRFKGRTTLFGGNQRTSPAQVRRSQYKKDGHEYGRHYF